MVRTISTPTGLKSPITLQSDFMLKKKTWVDMTDFMEYFHNAAASTNTYSVEMAKKYADTSRKALENDVPT